MITIQQIYARLSGAQAQEWPTRTFNSAGFALGSDSAFTVIYGTGNILNTICVTDSGCVGTVAAVRAWDTAANDGCCQIHLPIQRSAA